MNALLIVIADIDKEYIYPLLTKIIQHYGQTVEVAVFTQKNSLIEYLKNHFKVSVLVVSENFDIEIPIECRISQKIILTDRNKESYTETADNKEVYFYRYSPLELLFHVISSYCGTPNDVKNKLMGKTSVILVNSVTGGVGKTVIALSIAINLKNMGKKALYLDAEGFQNFECFLNNRDPVIPEAEKNFIRADGKLEQAIEAIVHTNSSLTYLQPMETPIVFQNKSLQIYINSIRTLLNKGKYDYIIVDTDGAMDLFKTQLISMCNQLVYVTSEQTSASYAINKFLKHISLTKSNIHIVYNRMSADSGMKPLQERFRRNIASVAYLPYLELTDSEMLIAIATQRELQELVFNLM